MTTAFYIFVDTSASAFRGRRREWINARERQEVKPMKNLFLTGAAALFLATGTARAEIVPTPRPKQPEADILAALRKHFPTAELSWWSNHNVNFFDGQWHRTCNLRLEPKPIKIYHCGIVHA
jgi:hypothetical protein